MKKTGVKKRIMAVLLSTVMAVTLLAGCGSSSSKPITLTVFSQLANYSGEQTGWSAQILLEKFNVVLNIVPDLNGTYSTRMEAGDLGDIVVFGSNGTDYTNAVNAGLLYDWNEDNLLQENGPYIYEHMQKALEFNASYSNGTTYGFGHGVAPDSDSIQDFFYTWDVRWDLYKQLGYPEVKTLDDMVGLFEKMKEICPTDDNGNPTYAVSLWPDWDGDMVMYVKSTATAYYGYDELGIGLYNPEDGSYYDCLSYNADGSYGPYLEALKFYNDLYQKGLLDPDSMTNTYDKMSEKVQAGGTFFSIFNYAGSAAYNSEEHLGAGKMMAALTPSLASPIVYGMDLNGGNRVWTIGAKTEYPELCMEIINYLCTPEGRMTMEYGPQGVTWDYDEDGNTYLTELGTSAMADGETSMEDAGYSGTFHDGQLQINNVTWAIDSVNPDSNGETYNYLNWSSTNAASAYDIQQDWKDYNGCNTTNEYMLKGNYTISPASQFVGSSRDSEMETKWDQTTNCITTYSWNAIYANSDEEFDSIVDEMIKTANSYYYAECLEWSQNEAKLRYAAECEATGK